MDSKYISLFEDSLLPTQDYLDDYKLFNVFYSFFHKTEKNLPIVPVREHPSRENQYLVLDGHHRITIAGLFNKPLNCFVAQSKNDFKERGFDLEKRVNLSDN